jgi:hypothetical protein
MGAIQLRNAMRSGCGEGGQAGDNIYKEDVTHLGSSRPEPRIVFVSTGSHCPCNGARSAELGHDDAAIPWTLGFGQRGELELSDLSACDSASQACGEDAVDQANVPRLFTLLACRLQACCKLSLDAVTLAACTFSSS